jgi:hypothetical protein
MVYSFLYSIFPALLCRQLEMIPDACEELRRVIVQSVTKPKDGRKIRYLGSWWVQSSRY